MLAILLVVGPNVVRAKHQPTGSGGSQSTAYETGLDDGTLASQRGDAGPNYDDCIDDGGNISAWGHVRVMRKDSVKWCEHQRE